MAYPSLTAIAADPFIIILILAIVRVNLFAKLAVEIVVVIFVAVFAEKAVFIVLNS
jgi:hypothetical protein